MAQLFSHLGRKSANPRLFQSIKPQSAMMQNLLDIESRTGGDRWMKAVDDELTRQKKTVELREGPSKFTRYFGQPIENLKSGRPILGETASRGGVPLTSSNVYVGTDVDPSNFSKYSNSLKGRNPYVQSLIDTMRHELGGHVAEQLVPGSPSTTMLDLATGNTRAAQARETAAQALVGDVNERGDYTQPTPRSQEVERYFGGVTPRKRDEDY